ncbi:MAG: PH domain-containing protein [Planctomycetota bacterium]|jgi:hypothetical protein
MTHEKPDYSNKDEIIFEVRPRWPLFVMVLLFYMVFIFACFLGYYEFITSGRPFYEPKENLLPRLVGFIISGLLVFVFGAYIVLTVFFLLRGIWTLRVTPAALIYRTWFSTIHIPWRDLHGIYLPREKDKNFSWARSLNPFIGIVLVENASVLPRLPWYLRFGAEKKNPYIILRKMWTNYSPEFLMSRLEQYKQHFSKYDYENGA